MPGFSFQSLFNEDPERQLVSGPGAASEWRIKPRSLMDEDADPRFPAFQQAWKKGAGIGDLFGPEPFKLQGTVSPSGGDNTRADVAKVQTLLGKAGYLDLGQDGPSGYANPNTDKAIRDFQKDNGLQVDGVLKPNGPTIAKLGGLLGGGGRPEPVHTNNIVQGEWDWQDKKQRPDFWPQPNIPRNSGNLLRILMGETPESAAWPKPSTTFPAPPAPASGKDYDEVEIPGGRNPNIPPTIIRVPKDRQLWEQATTAEQTSTGSAPFGSADGADHWAAGNMAQALLGRSDYADAVTHFRGEIGRNRAEAMPYLASVHLTMNEKNPELAAKFAGEMQKAGLAETPKPESGGAVLSAPIPPTVTPGPVPPAKPGETDIRIPAEPKPEPEKKPEGAAVPAASTTTPAPAPTAPPDTAKPGTPAQPAPTTEDTTDRTPVQRDAEVLKDPANVPGYTKWLAEGAKKDPQ
ncbi:MAG TPA: peptidoglycan-binding domain-containing protein [Magnetospirillum sp.]|nr:peptidoglycan-binding domain-containing protein [Magnetospirillum sp.]